MEYESFNYSDALSKCCCLSSGNKRNIWKTFRNILPFRWNETPFSRFCVFNKFLYFLFIPSSLRFILCYFFCLVKIETCFTFFCIRFLAQFSLRVGIHQRNGNQIFPLENNCVLRFTFSGRMKRIKAVDLVEIGMNSNECCRTVDYTLNLVCLIDYAHWPNHIHSRTNAQTHTHADTLLGV